MKVLEFLHDCVLHFGDLAWRTGWEISEIIRQTEEDREGWTAWEEKRKRAELLEISLVAST